MLKVTILQQDIVKADVMANIASADAAISVHPGADLYVLPEMFSTGYSSRPAEVAEHEPIASFSWLADAARRSGAAICASVACLADGAYRNRFVLAQPNGSLSFADKRHLFTFGGEHKLYAPGQQRVIVQVGELRCLLLVCYDLRFPVWSRNALNADGLPDYDAIIYVANWPQARIAEWDVLLAARAIENQCYVIAVNRVGSVGRAVYDGHSVILDPRGKVLARCPDGQVAAASAQLSKALLDEYRSQFPVLPDAD